MSIALYLFCFALPLTMLFVTAFFVTRNVGDCGWTIYARAVLIDFVFRKFSNNPPNSASMAEAMTFIVMLYYTCNGQFTRVIDCINGLNFVPGEKIHLLCFVPLILICRCIHIYIYVESLRFLYILLLCMDLSRCYFKIE